jgi:hypothetical protein
MMKKVKDTPETAIPDLHRDDDWTDEDLSRIVSATLTPSVTRSLPDDWQGDFTIDRAKDWIAGRDREGVTLLAVERTSRSPVVLMILFESDEEAFGRSI